MSSPPKKAATTRWTKPSQMFLYGVLIMLWPGSCVMCEYDPDKCGPYGEWVIARQEAYTPPPTCHDQCDGAEHRIVDGICYCAYTSAPEAPQ